MDRVFGDTDVGRKNIGLAVVLFLMLGVLVGVPLTINFFGGSVLTEEQYRMWKVIHGYGVFLAFVNYFFGFSIDRLDLTRRQKETASWAFFMAGVAGAVLRAILGLLTALDAFGVYASLVEVVGFVVGTLIFVTGQPHARVLSRIRPRPVGS